MVRRILIADDDVEVRQGAAELLGALGLEVLLAEDGDGALDAVVGTPDLRLALVDVHMPAPRAVLAEDLELVTTSEDEGGLYVLGALRRRTPEVPCILWSGAATAAVRDWALRSGARAFLRKPVAPHVLREEVARALADDSTGDLAG